MRLLRRPWLLVFVVLALVAAACGDDRDDDAAETTDATTTAAPADDGSTETTVAPADDGATTDATTTTAAPADVAMFGDMPWPCGPGDGANEDDGATRGVTADSVTIAIGDDAGFVSAPGLNKEMTDAMNALVAECNELGGINGREIVTNYYDGAIFEVATAMQQACDDDNFMLVGQGWAFDSAQEEIRLGCGLASAPTYTVSAAFAHGPGVFQGVPNPADETPAASMHQFATAQPDAVQAMGALVSDFSATRETRDKILAIAGDYGWTFVSEDIEYSANGEADWTPFVLQLQEAGVQGIYWSGSCLPNLQLFMQAAVANGLDVPVYTDANHYDALCAEANADGALDNVYIRMAFLPFEEATPDSAAQQYLDLVNASGGKIGLLGAQTASSFMLWAQAASDCGATLTRDCVIENMSSITSWTGGGLHTEVNPAENHPPDCGILMRLNGTAYERVAPTEPGTYECFDDGIGVIADAPALVPVLLDENRIATQFGELADR